MVGKFCSQFSKRVKYSERLRCWTGKSVRLMPGPPPLVILLSLSDDALNFLEKNPKACLRLIEVFCQRMRLTDERIAEIAMLQLPARLAKAFLRIIYEKPDSRSRGPLPVSRLSKRKLGCLIGATRERVNKCLREWQRRGIVRIEDGRITVLNQRRLEEVADDLD